MPSSSWEEKVRSVIRTVENRRSQTQARSETKGHATDDMVGRGGEGKNTLIGQDVKLTLLIQEQHDNSRAAVQSP